jgi:hypothetical protein
MKVGREGAMQKGREVGMKVGSYEGREQNS